MHLITGLVCALIGLLAGSAAQVVVKRSPLHEPLLHPQHHCANCGVRSEGAQWASLAAIATRNRYCNHCDVALWSRVPTVEMFCAIVLGVAGGRIGWLWPLPAYLVFFFTLAIITVIDLRHYLIPNRVIYPALFATIALLGVAAIGSHHGHRFLDACIGMAGAWLFFFIVWFVYPRGMGFGDVRLSALVGLASGWVGLGNVTLSVVLALFIGAGVGVILILFRFRNRKQAIPFGPFLAAGAAISILWGSQIIV